MFFTGRTQKVKPEGQVVFFIRTSEELPSAIYAIATAVLPFKSLTRRVPSISILLHWVLPNLNGPHRVDLLESRPDTGRGKLDFTHSATEYNDYLEGKLISGWRYGCQFYSNEALRDFASYIDYILGKSPHSMSYLVGFGDHSPHHGAPHRLFNSKQPNPDTIVGAMVASPDKWDGFRDICSNLGNHCRKCRFGSCTLWLCRVEALQSLKGKHILCNPSFVDIWTPATSTVDTDASKLTSQAGEKKEAIMIR
ncbi:unnamed protein product [Dovyalis caffra]|uniref:cellulase n=1 Tax=Dovyalis caffra TaxID=77055 RepID=A0AAV1SBL0_9ROSI|nr:unnamed protein product [Dovyalis caffra]